MRSYGQYCGLAKALDVVGDRWTLLIVRELLLSGPSRYTDLLKGLPGIATNMLVDRLKEMETADIIATEEAPPPVATTLFRLTDRGKALDEVIHAFGRWAGPMMSKPSPQETFRSHWLALPLEVYLTDNSPHLKPVTIELRTGDRPMLVETVEGRVQVRPGSSPKPDAVVAGQPHVIIGLLTGKLSLGAARARGVHFEGNQSVLRRVQPKLRAA
jgi:DNA-binding HxlR family transcriptional regulator